MSLLRKMSYCDEFVKQKTSKKSNSLGNGEGGGKGLVNTRTLTQNELDDWRREKSTELSMLREWLKKQPHLPQNITDEQFLTFLHSCWNSVEKTKQKVDNYFTIRTNSPEIFASRSLTSKDILHSLKLSRISPLRISSKNLNVIFIDCTDPNADFNFNTAIKAAGLAMDTLVRYFPREENNIIVLDMKNTVLAHVLKTNLMTLKKGLMFVQCALPYRISAIHVINAFPLVYQIQAMVKPFIDNELSKLIHIHMQDDMETFYKVIPRESLPKDYGGEESSLAELNKAFLEKMKEQEAYLEAIEHQLVNENRRSGNSKSSNDVFGVEGSFRRLEID